jgi:hypothetical protein
MSLAEIHAHLNSTLTDVKTSEHSYPSDSPAVFVMRYHLQQTIVGLIALTEEVQRLSPKPAPEFQTHFNRDLPRPK